MLELRNISKEYDNFSLTDISFSVRKGEYFVALGISGAGKSVLLEMIAGLISPDSGKIFLNGKDITQTKIQKREVGIVFQDFAVFPHMTVLENIIYPLKNIGTKRKKAIDMGKQVAREMKILHLINRIPGTLSGGELQRVALARTLVLKPDYLLLDEPMASVDVQLQEDLRALLRNINRKGITILHVTHSYEEAVSLASRIAVINNGKLIQTGSPKEVFHTPKSEFIAKFTGIKNFYNATRVDNYICLAENKTEIKHGSKTSKQNGYLMLRSEDVILSANNNPSSALNNFKGVVIDFFPCSYGLEVLVDVGIKISAHITQDSLENLDLQIGKKIWVSFKATAVKFIPH